MWKIQLIKYISSFIHPALALAISITFSHRTGNGSYFIVSKTATQYFRNAFNETRSLKHLYNALGLILLCLCYEMKRKCDCDYVRLWDVGGLTCTAARTPETLDKEKRVICTYKLPSTRERVPCLLIPFKFVWKTPGTGIWTWIWVGGEIAKNI